MNNAGTPQSNSLWVTTWERIFSQVTTEKEFNRLTTVKKAFDTQELSFSGDLTKFSKNKALAYYNRLVELRRPQLLANLAASKPENYHLISEVSQFNQVLTWLSQEETFILDAQITGASVFHDAQLVGLTLTLPKANQHVYIPIRHSVMETQLDASLVFSQLKPYFENDSLKKVLFNAKPILHLLRREHIKLKGLLMDTYIAAHLLNENEESYELYDLVAQYGRFLGFQDNFPKYKELFGTSSFDSIDLTLATIFACQKANLIQSYYEFVLRHFNRLPRIKSVYDNIENPLIEVCVEMEQTGFLIDMKYAETYKKELESELEKIVAQLKTLLGDIDFNSNKQLKKFYYEDLKLPDPSKSQKLDADALEQLKDYHPSIEWLSKYREISRLLSAYVLKFPPMVTKQHRLHGSFHQCGAETGRFSSSDPNLQNFPVEVRKMIIPPTGKIIVGIDYSQIEPRFLSHITQDPSFMQTYIEGRDLYSEIASKTFNLPISECGDGTKWRKMIKTGMLSTMYGTGARTLSKRLGVTEEEAEKFIADFFNTYPVMKQWVNQVDQFVDSNGYIETAWGRKRRFLGHTQIAEKYNTLHQEIAKKLNKPNFIIWEEKSIPYTLRKEFSELEYSYFQVRRKSVNSIIQGSTAEIMKLALIKLHQFLESKGPEWRLLATIHDEVLFEIPATATREEIEALAAVQRDAVQLSVPMKVDIEISQRWGCGMSLDKWFAHNESPLSLSQLF